MLPMDETQLHLPLASAIAENAPNVCLFFSRARANRRARPRAFQRTRAQPNRQNSTTKNCST